MQRGMAHFLVVAIIAVIIFGVAIGILLWQNNQNPAGGGLKACPAIARLCPDGSSVAPTGPDCQIPACPSVDPSPQDQLNEDFSTTPGSNGWLVYAHRYFSNDEPDFTISFPPLCKVDRGQPPTDQFIDCPGLFKIDLDAPGGGLGLDIVKDSMSKVSLGGKSFVRTFYHNTSTKVVLVIYGALDPESPAGFEVYYVNFSTQNEQLVEKIIATLKIM